MARGSLWPPAMTTASRTRSSKRLLLGLIPLLFAACLPTGTDTSGDSANVENDPVVTETASDQIAFDYFVGKGLTDVQAAGIVGNLDQESGMSPTIAQYGGGPGRGIAQWSVGGRWDTDARRQRRLVRGAAGRLDRLARAPARLHLVRADDVRLRVLGAARGDDGHRGGHCLPGLLRDLRRLRLVEPRRARRGCPRRLRRRRDAPLGPGELFGRRRRRYLHRHQRLRGDERLHVDRRSLRRCCRHRVLYA